MAEEAVIKRTMPHSLEAEQSVIGAMMMNREAIMRAAEILTQEDFYNQQYGIVFQAMVELNDEGTAVDIVTLQNRLKEKDLPPEVSSLEFVRNLITAVPTSANIKHYAGIVHEKAIKRKLIRACEEAAESCYAEHEDLNMIMENTEKSVMNIVQKRDTQDFVPIQDVVVEAMSRIEMASKTAGTITGIPTGFIDLDYRTAGLQPSDFILLAARPSMGKTALALNIAQYVAFHEKECVAIFSLEMSKVQLVNRLFSLESRVDSQHIRTGELSDHEWEDLIAGSSVVGSSKLIIDDTPGISLPEMRAKCRKFKQEFDLKLIIIDYLQLMSGSGRSDSRQQEVSDISRALKGLARELNVPIISLSQLSRAVEQRPDHRPMMSDLRESGAIEQDADVVMFIYRDDYYNHDTDKKNVAEVIIAKQRNGPIGTIELAWLPNYTKFANLQKNSDGTNRLPE
ncbi:MAG: replicative DNA helicase [Lachnospiraceae bacterium]|nr:replicative DNA helicase [Lachnospiraceae bacterium]